MKKLSIIDGSGFMFRARYAFPPFPTTDHANLNVVYGFLRMLMKLLDQSEYFVIARDAPTKTQRHQKYPDYKANRKKLEDEFKIQIPLLQSLITTLHIPNLVCPGYEADDIISTLTHSLQSDPSLSIHIYSSDKDLKQLLSNQVIITDPLKNITTTPLDFEKEFGFPPHAIVDYLALIGDSADNIKGVSGIWPKKASSLIQKFHTLDSLYLNLDKLSPDLRDKLKNGQEDAFFSKELIQLLTVPDIGAIPLDTFALNIDFTLWEEILVRQRGLIPLKKPLDELKKKKTQPQQLGLF